MKISRYTIAGIIFLLLSILIFFSNSLDFFIRPITELFLMGSSKGKDILFFAIIGLFLIFSQIFEYNNNFKENSIVKNLISFRISKILKFNNRFYLKISIILFLITAILGLILEVVMRYYLGIGQLTIFVSMVPDPTTTSIIHSHIYKAILGNIITSTLTNVPEGIHTADSLAQYVPVLANIIMIILPIMFLTLLASLKNRLFPTRLILIFAATCGLIGIVDGGLFSTPAIVGIFGMMIIYFDEYPLNYYIGKVLKIQSLTDKTRNKIIFIQKHSMKSYLTFKRTVPYIFLILIIILRISIAILGTNTEYYEVAIFDPVDNLDLDNYSILSINESSNNSSEKKNNTSNLNSDVVNGNNKVIIKFSAEYNEMDLLNSLTKSLENKSSSFTMSWNFYSYFKEYNNNMTSATNINE
ncbi:hypothetical protein MBCUT_18200 [Methanobrevibacter cuticularis]|uniref:Uncharacterized protein n=1 Tax=Methanobrevibacter cuticularis TaxID=47311 RepID=A0A166CZ24_9EURY|nr:hypothetical protein [Methanobrevibacter cuticularis]KZX15018.1 hypothetical protein MBCUT_18200 [Methanobrevibacter cuticularis]